MQPSASKTLLMMPAPRFFSSVAKRRLATRVTIAGVISQATSSTDSTTITGAARPTTISGASTVRKDVPKKDSTSLSPASTSERFSSVARTPATAGSQ